MKIRFYFDYSDYRSFLMAHTLERLDLLPMDVQWVAVDAYSLRALSGCDASQQSKGEREYRKQEALRFCRREGIEFVWPSEKFHSGSALRAGIWIMLHAPTQFKAFSKQVLEMTWRYGKTADLAAIQNILASLGMPQDAMLESAFEREYFQFQDACLQEALVDGVFDVPSVVIGEQMVCHYDMGAEIQRLVLVECLNELPRETILNAFARHLLSCTNDVLRQELTQLMAYGSVQQTVRPIGYAANPIQHTLAVPDTTWQIAKGHVQEPMLCHVCPPCQSFAEVLQNASEGALNIAWLNEAQLKAIPAKPDRTFAKPTLLVLRCAEGFCLMQQGCSGESHIQLLHGADFLTSSLNGWKIAVLSGTAALDLNMSRLACHLGAHVIIREDLGQLSGVSEAMGVVASAWCIEINANAANLVDSQSHRVALAQGMVTLDAGGSLKNSPLWIPSPPRTLLLIESPLTFGELTADADIEFACRGLNLLVTTAQQSSELSTTRVFEKLRMGRHTVLLLPLNGELIFVSELLSHRLVETLNQGPKDAVPFFVNFWNELEFEMLESMRSVLSAVASMFGIPVILVVGSQVAEFWMPNVQGGAWRIEKDGDCYTVDVAELLTMGQVFQVLLDNLQIDEATFLDRMGQIGNAIKG